MSNKSRVINALALFIWMGLISVLLYRHQVGTSFEAVQDIKDAFDKATYWHDIYYGGNKIGFAKTVVEKTGQEVKISEERVVSVLRVINGHEEKTTFTAKLTSLCRPDLSLKYIEYLSHYQDGNETRLTGRIDDANMVFILESAKKRKTHVIPTGGHNVYVMTTVAPALAKRNLAAGTALRIPMLNLSQLSIEEVKIVLEEIIPIKVQINVRSLFKFQIGDSKLWINENGAKVKEEASSGQITYLQNEAFANDPTSRTIFDYTSLPFFRSGKMITSNEDITSLAIRLKNFTLDSSLYEKSSTRLLNNDTLLMSKQDIESMKQQSYSLPIDDNDLARYLNPDRWVLSDDKNIIGNAQQMAIIEKNDAFRMSRYLTSTLYFDIVSGPVFSLSDARDLFKTHHGDYLERTLMFTTFSRAAGLPTRMVSGLVYLKGYFYFHAWPEVWLGQWIPVDPTLAQFPADATHIPLKEGTLTDLISIVDDLRNIKIEVLEVS